MTRYGLRHETRYSYGAPVELGHHLLWLTPREDDRQRLIDRRLAITPQPARLENFRDHFGNEVHHVTIASPHDDFTVVLEATVERNGRGGAPGEGPAWETVRAQLQHDGLPAAPTVAEFIYPSPLIDADREAASYAAESFAGGRPITAALSELNARIRRDFAYVPGATDLSTSVAQVMAAKRGVCQDFAHVMIAGLRGLGLPARYASGYVRTYPPRGKAERRGADASHAWVSAWCGPELGWLDFDPTNDLVVDDEHILLAYGRDFSDVTPLRGVILGGGAHTFEVAVSLAPLPPS